MAIFSDDGTFTVVQPQVSEAPAQAEASSQGVVKGGVFDGAAYQRSLSKFGDAPQFEPEWEWKPMERMEQSLKESLGSLLGASSAISKSLGADRASEYLADRSAQIFESAVNKQLVNTSFDEALSSPIDAAKYAVELITGYAPDLLMMALGGLGAGSLAGRTATRAFPKATELMLKKGFEKNLGKVAAEGTFKGATKDVVYKEAIRRTARDAGALIGVSGFEGAQGAGQAFLQDREINGANADPWKALAVGGAQSAISMLNPLNKLIAMGPKGTPVSILKMTAGEASEEMGQEIPAMMHEAGLDPNKTFEEILKSPEGRMRLIESGVAGALLGTSFGGGAKLLTGGFSKKAQAKATIDKTILNPQESLKEVGISTEGDVVDPTVSETSPTIDLPEGIAAPTVEAGAPFPKAPTEYEKIGMTMAQKQADRKAREAAEAERLAEEQRIKDTYGAEPTYKESAPKLPTTEEEAQANKSAEELKWAVRRKEIATEIARKRSEEALNAESPEDPQWKSNREKRRKAEAAAAIEAEFPTYPKNIEAKAKRDAEDSKKAEAELKKAEKAAKKAKTLVQKNTAKKEVTKAKKTADAADLAARKSEAQAEDVAKKKAEIEREIKMLEGMSKTDIAAEMEATPTEALAENEVDTNRAEALQATNTKDQKAILDSATEANKSGDWQGVKTIVDGTEVKLYQKDDGIIVQNKSGIDSPSRRSWGLVTTDSEGNRSNRGFFKSLSDAQDAHEKRQTAKEYYKESDVKKTKKTERKVKPLTAEQTDLIVNSDTDKITKKALGYTKINDDQGVIAEAIIDAAKTYDPTKQKKKQSFEQYAISRAVYAIRDNFKTDPTINWDSIDAELTEDGGTKAEMTSKKAVTEAIPEKAKVKKSRLKKADREALKAKEEAEAKEKAKNVSPVKKVEVSEKEKANLVKRHQERMEAQKKQKELAELTKLEEEKKKKKKKDADALLKKEQLPINKTKKSVKEQVEEIKATMDADPNNKAFDVVQGLINDFFQEPVKIEKAIFTKSQIARLGKKLFDTLENSQQLNHAYQAITSMLNNADPKLRAQLKTKAPKEVYPKYATNLKSKAIEVNRSNKSLSLEVKEAATDTKPVEGIARAVLKKNMQNPIEALETAKDMKMLPEHENLRPKVVKFLEDRLNKYLEDKREFDAKYKNALDVLEVAAQSDLPIPRQLARYLLDTVDWMKLQDIDVSKSYENARHQDGRVTLVNDTSPATIIHEIVHAITIKEMESNEILKGKVDTLMRIAEREAVKRGYIKQTELNSIKKLKNSYDFINSRHAKDNRNSYGFLNRNEFLSEAFSNVEFRNFLKSVKFKRSVKTSLWDKLMKYVGNFLKMDPKTISLLEAVYEMVPTIANSDVDVSVEAVAPSLSIAEETVESEKKPKKTREEQTQIMMENDVREKPVDALKDWLSKSKDLFKDISQSVTERLRKIDWRLMEPLRKMEFNISSDNKKYQEMIRDFVDGYQKMPKEDKVMLDLTLMNREEDDIKIRNEILKRNGLTKAYGKVEDVLKQIHRNKDMVGLNNYKDLADYFPRRVKDVRALMRTIKGDPNYNIIQAELDRLGEDATQADKENALQQMINTGRFPAIALLEPSSSKRRTIQRVSSEWKHHYANSTEALINHIYESNEAIHARKLFGDVHRKKLVQKRDQLYKDLEGLSDKAIATRKKKVGQILELEQKLEDFQGEFEAGISQLLTKIAPELGVNQGDEVIRLIRGRLTQKGMSGPLSSIRNVALMSVLSSPTSAITQIGDLAFSIYKYGPAATVKAMLGDKLIKPQDLDLTGSMKEFQTEGTAKWLDKTLKWSGLQAADTFFKSTTMQAALNSAKKMSLTEFKEKYGEYYGEDTDQMYQDIKNNENTELSRFFAFNELSDLQPVSMSEMPLKYLTAGNGRIMYALKSYNIKALNTIYRESVGKWKNAKTAGEKAKAAKDAGRLILLMTLAGATADELKDFLLGKDAGTFSDNVMNNLLKIGMVSRYTLNQGFSKGFAETILKDVLLPPTGVIDDPLTDIAKLIKGEPDFKTLNNLPWGKVAYNWFIPAAESKDMGNLKKQIVEQYVDGKSLSSIRSDMNKYNAWARKNKETVVSLGTLTRAKRAERKKERE